MAEAYRSERHDRHSFHLLEKGNLIIEIDFKTYNMNAPAIIYMHPDQVHRMITIDNVTVTSWAITNESLNPTYLKILEELSPAGPITLNEETFLLLFEAVSLCLKLSICKNDRLFHSMVKDAFNTLVAITISNYLEETSHTDNPSRYQSVANAFRKILEANFMTIKSPAVYAAQLNISGPYLNECVKDTTGHSVSYHIHQRIVLEAKRLLYHSNKSVKEIAIDLGYDDYPYFSRLFKKITGVSALAFRNKNYE